MRKKNILKIINKRSSNTEINPTFEIEHKYDWIYSSVSEKNWIKKDIMKWAYEKQINDFSKKTDKLITT